MKTSTNGIRVLHYYEGCSLIAYVDPGTGGEPITIGWGNTQPGLKLGSTITQAQADALFTKRLTEEFEPGVMAVLTQAVNQGQFDGCVCLAYNTGMSNFRSSTLVKRFNAGDIKGAADQFLRWDRANGQSMKGLRRRRASERALFIGMTADQAIAVGQAVN